MGNTLGNYTFTATSDDGVRVWVDGTLIIDGWSDHAATTYSTTVYVGSGAHTVQVDYYDHTLGALVAVGIKAE